MECNNILDRELISILQSEKDRWKNFYPRKTFVVKKIMGIQKELDELKGFN